MKKQSVREKIADKMWVHDVVDYKDCIEEDDSILSIILEALPEEETDNCKHTFWKDRIPDTCFNCGKTEAEIQENFYFQKFLKQIKDILKGE